MTDIAEIANRGTALEMRAQIYGQLSAASANEIVLEQSWMTLGAMLANFSAGEYWRDLGYESFPQFMLELRDKYKRGKTQLWAYFSVAKFLLPTIPAAQLEEMGISKAMELKKALEKSGKALPVEIIDAARQRATTIKEVRAMLGQALNLPDTHEPGSWFDFDGCYMTPDECKEFVGAVKMTLTLLGTKKELAEHVQRKAVFMAWLQEYVGTHSAEVYGPKETVNIPAKLLGASHVA